MTSEIPTASPTRSLLDRVSEAHRRRRNRQLVAWIRRTATYVPPRSGLPTGTVEIGRKRNSDAQDGWRYRTRSHSRHGQSMYTRIVLDPDFPDVLVAVSVRSWVVGLYEPPVLT